jgi:hypothetical protein
MGSRGSAPFLKTLTEDASIRDESRSQSKKESFSEFEYFAASLVVLEGHCFHKVVGSRIQILLDRVVHDDAFMSILKYLLWDPSYVRTQILRAIWWCVLFRDYYIDLHIFPWIAMVSMTREKIIRMKLGGQKSSFTFSKPFF